MKGAFIAALDHSIFQLVDIMIPIWNDESIPFNLHKMIIIKEDRLFVRGIPKLFGQFSAYFFFIIEGIKGSSRKSKKKKRIRKILVKATNIMLQSSVKNKNLTNAGLAYSN